ncbi:MAG TPA: CaiB/BaiF CoA-transferase family protein, partial [Pseudonocardiaceae bacterium]|nr:CaiB/BaiF CoA-transferase family protein [Pseudonocardiaceae bacterium]
PAECLQANPRLVYARLTGWGQSGPLASTAGHDINYIALTGALGSFVRTGQPPTPPLNLVGDFAGGSMYLIFGVLAALLERERSGLGQVVDAAMVDGVSSLMSFVYELRTKGVWGGEPGANLLDTGAPFYDVYRTADDRFVAVGCLEPQFYAAFLAGLGLAGEDLPGQYDPAGWPVLRARFAAILAGRTRDQWAEVFAGTDACVTPVLSLEEAPAHPHNAARGTFVTDESGAWAPAAAPRLSRTPGRPRA